MASHGLRSPPRCAASASATWCRATRALFDERGLQDAPIEEIARAVGIARGLIYRQFSSKEELYVLTVTDYLAELDGAAGRGDVAPTSSRSPSSRRGRTPTSASACATPRSWTARCRSCTGRPASCARRCRTPCGCAWAGDRELRGPRVGDPARRRPGRHVHRRGPRLHGQRAVDAGPRRHPPGPHPRRRAAGRAGHPGALHGRPRARSWTRAWPACWRPSAPSRQARPVEPQLRSVAATRYVEPLREGGSLPGLMEADDDGLYVAKYRGAGQGPAALVAEVVVGELARRLGLPVPELVTLGAARRAGAGRARPRDPGPALRQRGHQPGRRLPAGLAAVHAGRRGRDRSRAGGRRRVARRVDDQRRPHAAQPEPARVARAHVAHRPRRGALSPARLAPAGQHRARALPVDRRPRAARRGRAAARGRRAPGGARRRPR